MTAEQYKQAVETALAKWFADALQAAPSPEARTLVKRLDNLVRRGGKRARPLLFYQTYVAYGGHYQRSLVDVGLALELHHQMLLVHDDIIDDDIERYGGPNITGTYLADSDPTVGGRPQLAASIALLAGDLLFSFAHQAIVASHDISDQHKVQMLQLINDTNLSVGYGQLLDTLSLDPSPTAFSEDRLLLTHQLKTASYTVQLPMACAAALLDLPVAERQRIATFGQAFGILFQLADDYSDYFTNRSTFSKQASRPQFRDFRQGKVTQPLHQALLLMNRQQTTYVTKRLGDKDLPDDQMAEVIAIFESCGAAQASREYLQTYYRQTEHMLQALQLLPDAREQFVDLLNKYRVE